MDKVFYDYQKLKDRIREKCGTQAAFANAMGLTVSSVSRRLNNNAQWRLDEIENAVFLLSIPFVEIHNYFFTIKV